MSHEITMQQLHDLFWDVFEEEPEIHLITWCPNCGEVHSLTCPHCGGPAFDDMDDYNAYMKS